MVHLAIDFTATSPATSASRAAHAVNETLGAIVAGAVDGRTITIDVPPNYSGRVVEFMSLVENAKMDVDSSAKVVLNEKTGTVVMGREVRISEVSIIHGSLSLQVGTIFNVSQPTALSQGGQTAVVPETTVTMQEEKGKQEGKVEAPPADNGQSQAQKARRIGYEGDPCPECGHFTLVRNGTCLKCETCGGTTGCS